MSTVYISFKDHIYVHVHADDDSVLMDLQDHLTFYADGYRYNPKFKKGLWDGKIRLYSPYTRVMYAGLTSRVTSWLTMMGHEVIVDPRLIETETVTPQALAEFVGTLNLSRKQGVQRIQPYTFQWTGLYEAINAKRRTLEASTAGGKSLMIYIQCRWLLAQNPDAKILVVTDTTNLVEQLQENFVDYSWLDPSWDAVVNTHKIYSGQAMTSVAPIYISTWATMNHQSREYLSQFDMVIIDEAHKAKADSFRYILERCQCEYKTGYTGTIGDAKVHKYVIEGLIGRISTLLTNKEGRDLGITSDMKVEGIIFEYSAEDRKDYAAKAKKPTPAERKAGAMDKSYASEVAWLIDHEGRNARMCEFMAYVGGNSIGLFTIISHGMYLFEKLKREYPARRIFFISGDVPTKDRERLRQIMKDETNAIIIASYGTFSTGVDVPNLHQLFFCSPLESPIRLMQSLGRVGRLDASKEVAVVYHFGDDLRHSEKSNFNHTLRHFTNCFKRYDTEKIPYHVTTMKLT